MFNNKLRSGALRGAGVLLTVVTFVGGTAAATAEVHDASRHHPRHHHSGIPQHNGGDHDSDNNGAPSDGDGNL